MAKFYSDEEWRALPEAEKAKVRAEAAAERAEADKGLAVLIAAVTKHGMAVVKASKAGAAMLEKFRANPKTRDLTIQAALLFGGAAAVLSEIFYAGVESAWKILLGAAIRAGYKPERSVRWWGETDSFQAALKAVITRTEWKDAVVSLPPVTRREEGPKASSVEEWLAQRAARAIAEPEERQKTPEEFIRDLLAGCEPKSAVTPTASATAGTTVVDPFAELDKELSGGTTSGGGTTTDLPLDPLEAEMARLLTEDEPPAKKLVVPDERAVLKAHFEGQVKAGVKGAMILVNAINAPVKPYSDPPRPYTVEEVKGYAAKFHVPLPGEEAADEVVAAA